MKLFSVGLMLLVATLSLYAISDADVCKEVEKVSQESKLIYEKFDDTKNALILLNNTEFRRILNTKPSCMDEKVHLHYLEQYALYLSKTGDYHTPRYLEPLMKMYPESALFHKLLGNFYQKEFEKHTIPKMRDAALESYKRYIEFATKEKQKIDKDIQEFVKHGGLKKAQSTWADQLNISRDIPKNAFRAYYIDTTNPKRIVASETVSEINVNYPYKDFHNIDSGHFGGYWVGNIESKIDEKKVFYISFSNSKLRLIIDGYIVYEGQSNAEIPYTFTKGSHKVEVEYLNGWHTTSLAIKILPEIKKYTQQELKERLNLFENKALTFWYVGTHESKNKDNSINITLKKSDKPVVLLLESHRASTWKINNPLQTKVEAILIHSSTPQSSIEGEIDKNTPILYSQNRLATGYKLLQKCSCISGHFHCEDGIFSPKSFIFAPEGQTISGFSGAYSIHELSVPQEIMDDEKYAHIEIQKEKNEIQRKECSQNKNENFDTIFKK